MMKVEELIFQYEDTQREIMLFFHKLLTNGYGLIDKITFKNPCCYRNSWICYLKAIKNNQVELAFLRGNELSDTHGI